MPVIKHGTDNSITGFGRTVKAGIIIMTALSVLLTGCGSAAGAAGVTNGADEMQASTLPEELSESEILTGSIVTKGTLHDPQVIVGEDGTYYCYGSHMTAATSEDLMTWKSWANGVTKANKIFDNLLVDPLDAFSYVGKNDQRSYSVWAPSVIYNKKTGKYMMYFCTTSTYIKSDITLAVADDIGGPYHYEKTVLYSGFTKPVLNKTDYYDVMGEDKEVRSRYITAAGYNNQLWPNAIDPALFYDKDDRLWMVYGSWSGGIFLLEIDQDTGDVIHPVTDDEKEVDAYFGKRLIGGGHHPIEGPYIHYDEKMGYYYLFLSYGNLQADGGYQIRVLRSDAPDGTYTDVTGKSLGVNGDLDAFADYGTKLMGNYTLPSLDVTYMAPGGQSTFTGADGKLYIVYHQRYKNKGETHNVRVHQMAMNEDGWPCIFPFATNGESLSAEGYRQSDPTGTFYVVDHGLAVNSSVNESVACDFSGGNISGGLTGTYEVTDGTNYITMVIDGVTYKGVMINMTDEAGNNTFCISAIGDNNHSLWGVHYMKSEPDGKTE